MRNHGLFPKSEVLADDGKTLLVGSIEWTDTTLPIFDFTNSHKAPRTS
jgi:hypothetical protein